MSIIHCKVCGKITAITLYRRKNCGVLCSCQYKEIEKKAQKIVFDTIIANLHIKKNAVTMDEMIKSFQRFGKTAAETCESLNKAILAIQKISAENEGVPVIEVKDEKDALKTASLLGVSIPEGTDVRAFFVKEDNEGNNV